MALFCFAVMNGSSDARILRFAVAGSLAVHLVIASVVDSSTVAAAPDPKVTRFAIIAIKLPKPTPTPKPPEEPQQPKQQRHTRAVRPPIYSVKQTTTHNPNNRSAQVRIDVEPTGIADVGDNPATPGAMGTEVPAAPTPTPKPACSAPDVPAKTLVAVTPQTPADEQATNATAKIRIDLDATGNVLGVSVYESTGSMQLDHAALAAARESRYAPEEKKCKNVPGSYLFTVDFSS